MFMRTLIVLTILLSICTISKGQTDISNINISHATDLDSMLIHFPSLFFEETKIDPVRLTSNKNEFESGCIVKTGKNILIKTIQFDSLKNVEMISLAFGGKFIKEIEYIFKRNGDQVQMEERLLK